MPRHEVKPASTPDSIVENAVIEVKRTLTNPGRKIVPPRKQPNRTASVTNDTKDSLHKNDGSGIKISGVSERHQEHSDEMPMSARANEKMPNTAHPSDMVQDRSIAATKESTPLQWQERKETVTPVSAKVFTPQVGPGTKIRIDEVIGLARRQAPSGEDLRIQESDKSAEPIRVPQQTMSESARSSADEEKTDNTLPRRRLKPLQESAHSENYSLETGAIIRPAEQQEWPALAPAGSSSMIHSAYVRQPEETVVTINIGRIEVRADQARDQLLAPRSTFSPSLSLADYLKQRSKASTR